MFGLHSNIRRISQSSSDDESPPQPNAGANRVKRALFGPTDHEENLRFVNLGVRREATSVEVKARRLLLFLDYTCTVCTSKRCPVMDPRFDRVKSAGQKELGAALVGLVGGLSGAAKATQEYKAIEEVLRTFQ